MKKTDVERLLALLVATEGGPAQGTSIRIPQDLRAAAELATKMGLATSTTDLTVAGLRGVLEGLAAQAVLERHYQEFPHLRPSLADEALGLAELDGNPLAADPRIISKAAKELLTIKPNAHADDVLIYAAGLASVSATAS